MNCHNSHDNMESEKRFHWVSCSSSRIAAGASKGRDWNMTECQECCLLSFNLWPSQTLVDNHNTYTVEENWHDHLIAAAARFKTNLWGINLQPLVVLFYPDISNFTFWNVKNLKCKNFLIDFLHELGNFKQKKFCTSKCKFLLHFTATDPIFDL